MLLLILGACSEAAGDTAPPTTVSPSATPTPLLYVLVLSPERYAFGDGTPADTLIEGIGAINAADYLTGSQQINDTQLLEMNPDVILFTAGWSAEAILQWSNSGGYQILPAVQNNQLYRFPYALSEYHVGIKYKQYIALLKRLFWP